MAFTAAVFTSLAVWGGPGPVSAPMLESASVTDTASVSVSESVSTDALITASDTASVSITEDGVLVQLDANLTDLMPWGESGGYRDIGAKDLPATADVDVTDTASASVSDSATTEQLAEVAATDTASVTASEGAVGILQFEGLTTDLAAYCNPGTYRDIGDKPPPSSSQVDFDVFDDGSVSATEDPVDSQLLDTSDNGPVTLSSEVIDSLAVNLDTPQDTASVVLSESVSIEITGSLDIAVTDTASAQVSEALLLAAQSDVTDTASASASESSTVDIDVVPELVTVDVSDTASAASTDTADQLLKDPEFVDVTDTASAAVSETFVLENFEGQIDFGVFDEAFVSIAETVNVRVSGRGHPRGRHIYRVPRPHRITRT